MTYSTVVMSSGHGKYIRGASGSPIPPYLDEVDEARRVVDLTASMMRKRGVDITTFHDNVSTSQNENLNRIVDFHNGRTRQLDISVHFNANQYTTNPVGVEVWHYSQETLSRQISTSISKASGLKDRGPKYSSSLFFLNETTMPAVLLEISFVDSTADAELYNANFEAICDSIVDVIAGADAGTDPVPPEHPDVGALFTTTGKTSYFGGPYDTGVSASEGLAFIYEIDAAPQLFLPIVPPGTSGLARRLNTQVHYLACRWDYSVTPKSMLASGARALVRNPQTGFSLLAYPADWGPHEDTGRTSDLSPQLLEDLGLATDDVVEVVYPAPREVVGI